ncbi:MAG: YcxB family protein [Oscillospiraceae bacterium]|nr:YcxB family protein [Oscillospiraceae bacterium]
MAPIYVNESEITLEKYLYLCDKPIGKKAKKKLKNWRMLHIFAIVIMTVNAFVCYASDAQPLAIISLVFALVCVYKLLFQRKKVNTKQYNQIKENQGNEKWYRTITFDKDIKVTDGNTVTTFKYTEFVKLDENDRYYLLFKNENAVLRVEKGAFTTGDETKFVKFITNKIKKQKK